MPYTGNDFTERKKLLECLRYSRITAWVNACNRLGFAFSKIMFERLRVTPATATALALFHDTDCLIALVVDRRCEGVEELNLHPRIRAESIGLSWDDLLHFATTTSHTPRVEVVAGG